MLMPGKRIVKQHAPMLAENLIVAPGRVYRWFAGGGDQYFALVRRDGSPLAAVNFPLASVGAIADV